MSVVLVGGYLAAAAFSVRNPGERAALHYLVVATFGYGHLLGALKLPRTGALAAACWALAAVNALALYGAALERWPELVLVLLGISVWHAVENDAALGAAYAHGHRLGPHPRRMRPLLACAAATAGVLALAAAALEPRALAAEPLVAGPHAALAGLAPPGWLHFGDVFAAATLHHLVSFSLLLAARARALARSDRGAARRLRWRVAAFHALPALALALLPLCGPGGASLRAALLAPPLYLFFSVLHVIQTAYARRI